MSETTKKTRAGKSAEKTFEALLGRLEEIVAQLEKGDQPLEQSIRLFEEGMQLSSEGMRKLDDAERKVNLLLSEGGQEKTVPFPAEPGAKDQT